MQNTLDYSSDPRIISIKKANKIYFWSIKEQKIIKLDVNDAKTKSLLNCELCIPKYNVEQNKLKECEFRYNCFYKIKRHFVSCENKFGRTLIWLSKSDIPDVCELKRDRELGDLSSLKSVKIWRLEFKSKTIVKQRNKLFHYFKRNGCPCSDHLNNKCSVKFTSPKQFISHLIRIELSHKRFLVFKANSTELVINAESSEMELDNSSDSDHSSTNKSSSYLAERYKSDSTNDCLDDDSDSNDDNYSDAISSDFPVATIKKTRQCIRRSTGTKKRPVQTYVPETKLSKSSKRNNSKPTYTFIDTSEEEELSNRPLTSFQNTFNCNNNLPNRNIPIEIGLQSNTKNWRAIHTGESDSDDQEFLIEKIYHHVKNGTVSRLYPKDVYF